MIGRFAVGAITAGLLLAGCSDPPKQGVVVSIEYDAAHYDTYLYCGQYMTVNKVLTCMVWLPAQSYVPDNWSLKLRNGSDEGWRDVPKPVYEVCGMGTRYPDCAGGAR